MYAYVANPANIPTWAPGLGTGIDQVNGEWFVETPGGRVKVAFAARNEFGVLDHEVTFADGQVFQNPLRVVPYGGSSEIVFSVRRMPGVPDADFARDVAAVTADLGRLKRILEAEPR